MLCIYAKIPVHGEHFKYTIMIMIKFTVKCCLFFPPLPPILMLFKSCLEKFYPTQSQVCWMPTPLLSIAVPSTSPYGIAGHSSETGGRNHSTWQGTRHPTHYWVHYSGMRYCFEGWLSALSSEIRKPVSCLTSAGRT